MEVKYLPQGHIISTRYNEDLVPGSLTPEPLIILSYCFSHRGESETLQP